MLFMQAYLWAMALYVLGAILVTPFAFRKLAAAGYTASMWFEQVASYALLIVGLVGVYGFVYSVPVFAPAFWQVFFVLLD